MIFTVFVAGILSCPQPSKVAALFLMMDPHARRENLFSCLPASFGILSLLLCEGLREIIKSLAGLCIISISYGFFYSAAKNKSNQAVMGFSSLMKRFLLSEI